MRVDACAGFLLTLVLCAGCGNSSSDASRQNADGADAGTLCTACDGACEEFVLVTAPPTHQEGDLGYGDPPPAGGVHSGCWAKWGAHDEEVRPENWVHNLEHGGVVLLHHCSDGCDEEVAQLAAFAEAHERVVATPYTRMTARFAAIAWEYRLMATCLDMEATTRFYDAHVGSANAPEPSATGDPSSDCP